MKTVLFFPKIRFGAAVLALLWSANLNAATALPEARIDERHRTFLQNNCTECHGDKKQKGELRLDDISFLLNTPEAADVWQKILTQLNSGEMPPDDAKQPEAVAKAEFLETLSMTLVTARKVLGDQFGKIEMRRLNRREYKNTIRALLGVEMDVANELPADGDARTFDTVGSSLFMSSEQFEQYLVVGRKALDEAFARMNPVFPPGPKLLKKHLEPETSVNASMEKNFRILEERYGRYKQWTDTIDAAAQLPENQAIVAELRRKVPNPTDTRFYTLGWKEIKGSRPPMEFGFKDEGAADFDGRIRYQRNALDMKAYLELPNVEEGAFLGITAINPALGDTVPAKWPAGDYLMRFRLAASDAAPPERRFVQVGVKDTTRPDSFEIFSSHQVTGTMAEPQILEVRVSVPKTGNRTFSIREKRRVMRGTEQELYNESFYKTRLGPKPVIWVDWVEFEGPLPVASTALHFGASGAPELQRARQTLEAFATAAFREREPEPEYLDGLVHLYERSLAEGAAFEDALKEAMSVVLASPNFIYLSEPASDASRRWLTLRELAVRLSYFLWSAPPDETLLSLVRSKELAKPEVITAQVERMLQDDRSFEFTKEFTRQWLAMERLDFFQFNSKLFPTFDDSTKMAAKYEVYRTVELLLRENLPISHLLTSSFVVVNGLMANHYGIPNVTGDHFRKVPVPPDSPRGGLLGMAGILAMGGNGEHTSPVERGVWILKKVLNEPPPPAPANVAQLSRLESRLLTNRERLLAHQEQPQCAQCHRKIDPIGFGLENFDAVGLWRTKDHYEKKGVGTKEWDIDPAGAFYKGPAFQNYFELRDRIAANPERIARSFAEALLQYGLGRPVGFSDDDLVRSMLQQAGQKQYAMREFILALVRSQTFQSK